MTEALKKLMYFMTDWSEEGYDDDQQQDFYPHSYDSLLVIPCRWSNSLNTLKHVPKRHGLWREVSFGIVSRINNFKVDNDHTTTSDYMA